MLMQLASMSVSMKSFHSISFPNEWGGFYVNPDEQTQLQKFPFN